VVCFISLRDKHMLGYEIAIRLTDRQRPVFFSLDRSFWKSASIGLLLSNDLNGSQAFLSSTQITDWWTPRDASLELRMKNNDCADDFC